MKEKTKGILLLAAGILILLAGAVFAVSSEASAAMILLLSASIGIVLIICGIYLIRSASRIEREKRAYEQLEKGKAYRRYRKRRNLLWLLAAGMIFLSAVVYNFAPYQIILVLGILLALAPLLYGAFHPFWKCPYCGRELPLNVSSRETFLPSKSPDLSIRKCPGCGHKLIYPD